MNNKESVIRSIEAVRLVLLDVDGVLTDGTIIYADNGDQIKKFNVKDGLGIRMLQNFGIEVGIVTGRVAEALNHRCRDLNISLILDGVKDKGKVLTQITEITQIAPEETAFMGDDLPDLSLMRKIGLSVAPADAHPSVISEVAYVTKACGGKGAVRELCETIIKTQGGRDSVINQF